MAVVVDWARWASVGLASTLLACGAGSEGGAAEQGTTTGGADASTGRTAGFTDTAAGPGGSSAEGMGSASAGTASSTAAGSETGPAPGVSATGLLAVPADAAVGLEWRLVERALGYNVYWSNTPEVSPSTAAVITDVSPGFVHRGLENGAPHHYVVTALLPNGEGEPSDEVSATPGGPWQLFHFGPGTIEDLRRSDSTWIPIEDRVHVVVLSEGYLPGELEVFSADAQRWFDDVFAVEPYAAFPEAFVVWTLPRASNEHVSASDPQAADTAFAVPITADGSGISSDLPSDGVTATRVWAELDSFAYPPTRFWPAGGRTNEIAKNLVAHTLVFDPELGRSGFSGRSRRLQNPAAPDQRLSVAFAINLAHEFTHAFARLEDEYLDVDQSDLGEDNALADQSAWVSNVVMQPSCGTVPWRHLFVGSEINPNQGELVGSFGTEVIGYHSEFKCLMNGTHDNAAYYGGDGRLRAEDRMCNWCRELATFRLWERLGLLDDPAVSFATWSTDMRAPFYERFGLAAPAVVPQENSDGDPWFQACAE